MQGILWLLVSVLNLTEKAVKSKKGQKIGKLQSQIDGFAELIKPKDLNLNSIGLKTMLMEQVDGA